jgi:hypothetical protein
VRQAIRIASSYGPVPEEYVFRIESKDKEIPSSPPTHHNNQNRSSNDTTNAQNDKCSANDDKRSANDVAATTPVFVIYRECCGGWGHEKPFRKWAKHAMANNSEKSFKNSHAGTGIWRLVGADKFMYEIVKKDDWKLLDNDYNARRANNPPNKTQKTSVNHKGSNPKAYEQLYGKNTATNSSGVAKMPSGTWDAKEKGKKD